MDIISFMMGFQKGKASTPTQEKAVDITENGTTEVMPDDGYALSKVTVNTNVESSGGGMNYKRQYVTIAGVWKERVSVDFGFKPKVLLIYPADVKSVVSSQKYFAFFGTVSEFGTVQFMTYINMDGKATTQLESSSIDETDTSVPIYDADETGFNMGKTAAAGGYYVVATG